MIFDLFDRIRERGITNTKELTWKIMAKEYKYENNKNINEKKENENEKIKETTQISQLIDERSEDIVCSMAPTTSHISVFEFFIIGL